ncbi:hypothetical protein [Enterococcus diestrammenae]|uniref:Uncharacterized protein n=1 Tax=Enterococcus diestrammenae TaxID=1155073 RepID=A0ABV0EY23_9ENTE|nr:hypothetical protein [Enterococcus diestrammenae]KAF1299015.1 hypothetical protein BAU18_05240 [Enterococcus diestrammenae]HIX69680.1 hypothetical protein [Candidatus Enterococcus stercoravium]
MYNQQFEALHLNVVEMPLEVEGNVPVYRGFIRELPFLAGSGHSVQELYRSLLEAYQEYAQEQLAAQQEEQEKEEMTSSLLSFDDLLKYYDGESFDGFSIGEQDE